MHATKSYFITSQAESATAAVIFARMNEVFLSNEISWMNCIGAGVDNTSVNLGRKNSILTRVLEKNPSIYFMGCPCHIVHNTCMTASGMFTMVSVCENYSY